MSDRRPHPTKSLNATDVYPCPVCRHGQISSLPMMEETFACNFCQHLFTAQWEQQLLKIVDVQIPLIWRWNGKRWRDLRREKLDFGWGYAIAALVFVLVPPSLVGLAAYWFPPLPDDPLWWLPLAWTGLTLVVHLACLLWLVAEYYQFPILMYLRALWRRRRS